MQSTEYLNDLPAIYISGMLNNLNSTVSTPTTYPGVVIVFNSFTVPSVPPEGLVTTEISSTSVTLSGLHLLSTSRMGSSESIESLLLRSEQPPQYC